MEFYEELLLTALISLLLAFLIGRIAAANDAADRPRSVPLAADLGLRRGVGLDPVEAEAEKREGKSSGDARGTGVALAESNPAEAGAAEVQEQEVGGFDLEKENIEEKFPTQVEVDVPTVEESSTKEEEEDEVVIGRIADDFIMQGEEKIVRDEADVDKTVETVVESSVKKEDIEVEVGRIADDLVKQGGGVVKDEADVEGAVEKVVELDGQDAVEKEDTKDTRSAKEEKEVSLLHGEDDWEGIERSEVEKLFAVAADFVASEKGGEEVSKLSNEVQMQLYGLHKVSTEGPCYEPQPMALKVSARAKWHAWQRLGNMNPEAAMEQYISLLTENTPGWMVEKPGEEAKGHDGNDPVAAEVSRIGQHESKSSSQDKSETESHQLNNVMTCVLVGNSYSTEGAADTVDTGPKIFKEGLTKLFLFKLLSPTRVAF